MNSRTTPIQINADEFKRTGYQLIDAIADFFATIEDRPVTKHASSKQLQDLLTIQSLPEYGRPVKELMSKATDLVMNHSLLNGHPRFLGYITSSPAPIGALADLLAAAVNPNVGAQILSPIATEIEKQTIKWLSEFIGVSPSYGGILVSGGNMANFTAFLAARNAKAPEGFKEKGFHATSAQLTIYCSKTTHIWIEKAAALFGHGYQSIRWINTDASNRMDNNALEAAIEKDIAEGNKPFIVIGTAGDVSTGVVDDLSEIAAVAKKYNCWFHIDGAYGIPAAVIPELKSMFKGITEADSIALDPHKWLYSPLEAGCTLVKDPNHLIDTYSAHPVYFNFGNSEEAVFQNYYEFGFQNSRGFRALKVWLILQQVGRAGYEKMIRQDIELSKLFFELAEKHPELEAMTQNLSITTLRYVPADLAHDENRDAYLNKLNETLLNVLQQGGEMFVSNALINDCYCLRGCIVNFRTSKEDIEQMIEIIVREGRIVNGELQKETNKLATKLVN